MVDQFFTFLNTAAGRYDIFNDALSFTREHFIRHIF